MGKEIMAVHIKLQSERSPGGNTQVAQSQFFVNEIKVIVEAFTPVRLEEGLPCGLIMPWLNGLCQMEITIT